MKLKPRQEEILIYLYRFRFLNRTQIQKLLCHKHFNRIIVWLNQLNTYGYIRKYYNPKTVTIAAIYSLDSMGRKYLLEKSKEEGSRIQPELLNRIWREHTLSEQFRIHCLFLADIYLSLSDLVTQNKAVLYFFTKTDLHGHDYLPDPRPDAYFAIKEAKRKTKRYFLDIFDPLPPRMILRRRVKQYVDYFDENDWQEATNHPFPQIILISPDERTKRYLNRYIKTKMEYTSDIEFYLSTWEPIRTKGMKKEVFEKVEESE